jgi:translation initiation factor 5B
MSPIYKIELTNLSKEDILEAKLFKEENFKFGAVFVFNKKIMPDLEEYAESQEIKIFSSNVIYKIFEDYAKWVKEQEEKNKKSRTCRYNIYLWNLR